MGIRIQPKDIDIPEDKPFQNDLLDRKEPAEILTHLIGSIDGPCVLVIDAAWGNGKSTFLRLWSQHLRNEKFPVVILNAWETDFSENPFVTLSTELTDGLQEHAGQPIQEMIRTVQTSAVDIALRSAPYILRWLSGGLLTGDSQLETEVRKSISEVAENHLSAYRKARNAVEDFKEKLYTMVENVSERHKNKPVVIMIDELDRCRPSYAVELLEVAKHLFSVDRIIFVLAINRAELGHSVKALYGQEFDANGYLKRFIDIDFVLPEPSRDQFISSCLRKTNIEEYFQRTKDDEARSGGRLFMGTLMGKYWGSSVSLRQISQAIHRISLVLASLPINKKWFLEETVIALILRTLNENLYHRFRVGKATDFDVVDTIFPGRENNSLLDEEHRFWFEGTIILGYREISNQSSALLEHYRNTAASEEPDDDALRKYWQHAKTVLDRWDPDRGCRYIDNHGSFQFATRRIELFAKELKGDTGFNTNSSD